MYGQCINGTCVCNNGYTGNHEWQSLVGTDCTTSTLARTILYSISCAIAGLTAIFAGYRLVTILPLKNPPNPKQLTCMGLSVTFTGRIFREISDLIAWCLNALTLMAQGTFMHERGYNWFLFWLSVSGAMFNILNKGLIFIRVALATETSSLGTLFPYMVTL
jgi:hypothetical protein